MKYELYDSDENRQAMIDAFCAIFQGAEYHYAHVVFDDQNWDGDSLTDAIRDVDQFHDGNVKKYGERTEKAMREATVHMLHILKILEDEMTAQVEDYVADIGRTNG